MIGERQAWKKFNSKRFNDDNDNTKSNPAALLSKPRSSRASNAFGNVVGATAPDDIYCNRQEKCNSPSESTTINDNLWKSAPLESFEDGICTSVPTVKEKSTPPKKASLHRAGTLPMDTERIWKLASKKSSLHRSGTLPAEDIASKSDFPKTKKSEIPPDISGIRGYCPALPDKESFLKKRHSLCDAYLRNANKSYTKAADKMAFTSGSFISSPRPRQRGSVDIVPADIDAGCQKGKIQLEEQEYKTLLERQRVIKGMADKMNVSVTCIKSKPQLMKAVDSHLSAYVTSHSKSQELSSKSQELGADNLCKQECLDLCEPECLESPRDVEPLETLRIPESHTKIIPDISEEMHMAPALREKCKSLHFNVDSNMQLVTTLPSPFPLDREEGSDHPAQVVESQGKVAFKEVGNKDESPSEAQLKSDLKRSLFVRRQTVKDTEVAFRGKVDESDETWHSNINDTLGSRSGSF